MRVELSAHQRQGQPDEEREPRGRGHGEVRRSEHRRRRDRGCAERLVLGEVRAHGRGVEPEQLQGSAHGEPRGEVPHEGAEHGTYDDRPGHQELEGVHPVEPEQGPHHGAQGDLGHHGDTMPMMVFMSMFRSRGTDWRFTSTPRSMSSLSMSRSSSSTHTEYEICFAASEPLLFPMLSFM